MSSLTFENIGPFEVAYCPGQNALAHLEQLRSDGRTAGYTAILLGDKKDAEILAENREDSGASPEESLQSAATIDVDDWLKKRATGYLAGRADELGEWPTRVPPAGGIGAHLEALSREPKKLVAIAKIPTSRNWEAPAFIGMGGFNECPGDATLTAFAKRWNERYGAEIVSITHDIMEFSVSRPPTTRDQALILAKEQYLFCSDIVDQGVRDISTLAAILLNGNYWYFWWD